MEYMRRTLVSEKVMDFTMYNNGRHRQYISLVSLKSLFKQICEINECPEYISITPFYKHSTRDFGIELDEYMCYIKSTLENVTPELEKSFREDCTDECVFENVMTKLSKSLQESYVETKALVVAEKQYHLVNCFDISGFHVSLWRYMEYLYSLIPVLIKQIKDAYSLSDTELFLGEFCFEIHCD